MIFFLRGSHKFFAFLGSFSIPPCLCLSVKRWSQINERERFQMNAIYLSIYLSISLIYAYYYDQNKIEQYKRK